MKILHVITSLNDGGAQAVLYNLIRNDTSNEHVVICLSVEGKYSGFLQNLEVEVHHLDMPRGKVRFAAIASLVRCIGEIGPDTVQTWMYHSDLLGGVAARLNGVKNVVWGIHHSSLDKHGTAFSTRMIVWVLRWLSWVVPKAIISCSKKALELHVQAGYREDKMRFVANGYDLDLYKLGKSSLVSLVEPPDLPANIMVFATVARWDPQKDHHNLIRAAAILRNDGVTDFACLFIGPNVDSSNSELCAHIVKSDVQENVFLCGVSTDIPAIMNFVDCHVLPSSFGEAFPNVVAEAMACSVPCIVTDVGDAGDMVGEDGWVVCPSDPSALAEAMKSALAAWKSDISWKELKLMCREKALGDFEINRMIAAYHSVWDEKVGEDHLS